MSRKKKKKWKKKINEATKLQQAQLTVPTNSLSIQ